MSFSPVFSVITASPRGFPFLSPDLATRAVHRQPWEGQPSRQNVLVQQAIRDWHLLRAKITSRWAISSGSSASPTTIQTTRVNTSLISSLKEKLEMTLPARLETDGTTNRSSDLKIAASETLFILLKEKLPAINIYLNRRLKVPVFTLVFTADLT